MSTASTRFLSPIVDLELAGPRPPHAGMITRLPHPQACAACARSAHRTCRSGCDSWRRGERCSRVDCRPIPVHMMELHAQRLPLPLSDAALLTSVVLQTLGKQATLQMGPIRPSSDDEQCVEGKQTGARRDVTSPHSVSPRLRGKTKPPPAFTHRHAGLVHTADLAPIEAASELSSRRNAELSSVVTHSRLRDTELPRDLGNPETLVEQVGNRPTALPGRALRSPWPRSDLAPADRRCPSGVGETEPTLACLGTWSAS